MVNPHRYHPAVSTPDSSRTKNTVGGIVRAVAGEFPIVGAFVSGAGAVVDARQRERDEEFFAMLSARVTLTQDQLGAIERGENETFVATANRVVRESRDTADRARLSMLANVLASTAAMPRMCLSGLRRRCLLDLRRGSGEV
jgi:hypothetical protein